jgi:hypothetical protein
MQRAKGEVPDATHTRGQTTMATTQQDAEFTAWMKKVDAHIAAKCCGLTSDDLPDICYRDLFDDGTSPASAARKAIRYEKGLD